MPGNENEASSTSASAQPQGPKSRRHIPLPPNIKLRGNLKSNWNIFKQLWTSYETLTGLKKEDSVFRVATFVTCIGTEALEVHNGLPFNSEAERNDIDKILGLWEEYCVGRTNVIFERYQCNQCNQGPEEPFDSYVVKLRKLAASCEYGEMTDDMLRDRIVGGIVDNQIRKTLLQESKLTLAMCISVVQSAEATAAHAKSMSHSTTTTSVNTLDVNAVKNKASKSTYKTERAVRSKRMTADCKFCGKAHPLVKSECPALGKTCTSCGKPNHFAIKCREKHRQKNPRKSSTKRHVKYVYEDSDTDQTSCSNDEVECSVIDLFDNVKIEVNNVSADTECNQEKYQTKILAMLQVQGQPVKMQVDCGASCNVLPDDYLPAGTVMAETKKKLRMYSKDVVPVLGTCKLHVKNPKNGRKYLVPFYVVRAVSSQLPLIGSRTGQQMRLITVNYENIATVDLEDDLVMY